MILDHKTLAFLNSQGYTDIKNIGGTTCAINRFMFTYGILIGLSMGGYRGRFCFDTYQNAKLFFNEWDGEQLPEVGLDGCTAIKI